MSKVPIRVLGAILHSDPTASLQPDSLNAVAFARRATEYYLAILAVETMVRISGTRQTEQTTHRHQSAAKSDSHHVLPSAGGLSGF